MQCWSIVGLPGVGPIEFDTGESETALICKRGRAFIITHDESYELGVCDLLYVPRRSDIRVDADGNGCELLEVSAPVNHDYPVRHKLLSEALPYADSAEVSMLGGMGETGRLVVGLTWGSECSGAECLQFPVALPEELKIGDGGTLWIRVVERLEPATERSSS